MLRKLAAALVKEEIDRRTVRPDKKLAVEGYKPLPEILGALYDWLFIPFNKAEILVEIRYPRSTQLPEVDKLFRLRGKTGQGAALSRQDIIDAMNIQEECCKAVLNRPTFSELEAAIWGKDCVLKSRKERFAELREKLESATGFEKHELQKEIDALELFIGYALPDDTMFALTNIALGIGVSDIKSVTKEKLITAYHKARLYGQRPSDFIPGLFTDGDRQNIDDYATYFGSMEESRRMKQRK